jgi:tryptophan synthase alpha chain
MSRISQTLTTLKQNHKKAFVTYIVAGDPDLKISLQNMHDLVDGGADIIELGMPFTDPMADGPVIQAAHLRALANGTDLKSILQLVRDFRTQNQTTPIVLMGYANPIHAYGIDEFYKDANNTGIDGTLIVDIPPEEDGEWIAASRAHDLDFIRLATPTTTPDRLKKITAHASGFLYYVSVAGITGSAISNINAVREHVDMIKSHTKLPIMIGFGIKTRDDAINMSAIADGIVVGSAIIDAQTKGKSIKSIVGILRI